MLSAVLDIPAGLTGLAFDEQVRTLCPAGFIGVDEAGRGPLAGPVAAAAVILPAGHGIEGLADSKKLTEAARERLYPLILEKAVAHAVVFADEARIETMNILYAALWAMAMAVQKLDSTLPVLVDGNKTIPGIQNTQIAVVKGDRRSGIIGAASILAKVTRDRHMVQMDTQYPGFGFAIHKGYGTANHLARLRQLGACPIHRKSFKGVLV